jgi:ribose 5-phosphate isomerase B
MKIALGTDHAGFELKQEIGEFLQQRGFDVTDVGAHAYDALDDYPDFAKLVADAVAGGDVERGILLCGSGVGASIVANKVQGARAAMCHDTYSAHQGVEHDDMNILCVGARIVGVELVRELIIAFLNATFSGEERHLRRLRKMQAIESTGFSTSRT